MPEYVFQCKHDDTYYTRFVYRGIKEPGDIPAPLCWCGKACVRDYSSVQITASPMHIREEWKDPYWDSLEGRKESDRLYEKSWTREPDADQIPGMKTVGEEISDG